MAERIDNAGPPTYLSDRSFVDEEASMPTKKALLTAADVNGAWAIIPTPAKPGAESWKMEDTVDVDETARVVDGLIEAGIDAILSMGTLGECATLTWEEKQKFMSTLVETARGRVPVFVGTTTLNTRDTIRETRWAADLGADGTMLGLPMWCAMSVPGAVQFYRDVTEAVPNMAMSSAGEMGVGSSSAKGRVMASSRPRTSPSSLPRSQAPIISAMLASV